MTWEVGSTALVTAAADRPTPYRATFDGETWRDLTGVFCVNEPTTIHPLAVVDPADRNDRGVVEITQAIGSALNYETGADLSTIRRAVQDALTRVADPRPAPVEPARFGAVVEDRRGVKWLRVGDETMAKAWAREGNVSASGTWCRYADIDAVRELAEGAPS